MCEARKDEVNSEHAISVDCDKNTMTADCDVICSLPGGCGG
jgi:hypothetical protein